MQWSKQTGFFKPIKSLPHKRELLFSSKLRYESKTVSWKQKLRSFHTVSTRLFDNQQELAAESRNVVQIKQKGLFLKINKHKLTNPAALYRRRLYGQRGSAEFLNLLYFKLTGYQVLNVRKLSFFQLIVSLRCTVFHYLHDFMRGKICSF